MRTFMCTVGTCGLRGCITSDTPSASKAAPASSGRVDDGGSVIVNPTLFDARVAFTARQRDASSGQIDQEFLLPTQDGRIYLPTTAARTPGAWPEPSPALVLSGPERWVERGGRVVLRLGRTAALFDGRGELSKRWS